MIISALFFLLLHDAKIKSSNKLNNNRVPKGNKKLTDTL